MKLALKKRDLQNGMQSLYIEYYKGYFKDVDGKIKHKREKEYLNLYINKSSKNAAEKQKDKETLLLAEKILIKRQNDINEGKHGFKTGKKKDVNFIQYFTKLAEERKNSKGNYGNWDSTLKHLRNYCDADLTTFKDINEDFVKGFKDYLETKAFTKSTVPLSQNTKHSYFNKLKACLNRAFEEKLLDENPLSYVKGFKQGDPVREYLSLEELQTLSRTDCRYPVLKSAFLFSCLTGLRWSDIQKLTWSEVRSSGSYKIVFRQQKTKSLEYLDISEQAYNILGPAGPNEERVFKGLKYGSYMNVELTKWCLKAGITKDITFHCARHTFATLQLTLGTDIYTVSKLLGHKHLATTQIYAKVIDEKKREAVNRIPELLINF